MRWVSAVLASAVTLSLACLHNSVRAEDFYVAPDGVDGQPGTRDRPFRTIEQAQTRAAPGDTVYIRGGVYKFSGTQASVGVSFTKSGSSGKPIRYFAAPGEVPIFDFFELKPQARVTGFDVRCNWIHIRGLEVRGVRQLIVGDSWSVRIRGDHNVIEQLNVHDGQAPGIFITSGASNLILHCDSHHNYDPLESGGNADGFGCHSAGGDNVFRGCRAYENSDDGFDFINAPGTCTAEGSWAFRNGFIPDTNMAGANGSGFKSGGFGNPPNIPASGVPRHVIRFNLAFGNRAIGIYANHHPGGIDFFNNTSFDNPSNFDMRVTGATSSHKLRNNLAVAPGRAIVNFNGGSDDVNSWTLPVQVSDADFVSMERSQALAARQPDGSLPVITFMHLAPGSDLTDRGEDVGLPSVGAAPDLGAFELGGSTPSEPTSPMDAGMPDAAVAQDASVPSGAAGSSAAGSGTPGVAGRRADSSTGGVSGAVAGATPSAMTGAGRSAPLTAAGRGSALTAAGAPGSGLPQPGAPPAPAPASSGCSCRVGAAGARDARGDATATWLSAWVLVCLIARARVRPRR